MQATDLPLPEDVIVALAEALWAKMKATDFPLPEDVIAALAEALWAKMIGSSCDPVELNLRAKLALERHLIGGNRVPFGLDKLGTSETASYIGVQPETLRDKVKRRHLGLPAPYAFARKLFWRRSELDAWVETQRPAKADNFLASPSSDGRSSLAPASDLNQCAERQDPMRAPSVERISKAGIESIRGRVARKLADERAIGAGAKLAAPRRRGRPHKLQEAAHHES
jgi:hypothetical protein